MKKAVGEPLFVHVFEGSREGICMLDAAQRPFSVNARLRQWLGYRELSDYDLDKIVHQPHNYRRLWQALQQAHDPRGPFELELKSVKGELIPVQLRLHYLGQNLSWLMFFSDLRREKQLESTLSGSFDQHVQVLNALPVPIVVARLSDSLILQSNEEFAQWYGVPVNSLIGMHVHSFLAHHSDWGFLSSERPETHRPASREVLVNNPDGTQTWASTQGQVIQFEGGPALLLIFQDINQSKQNEKALKWRNDLVAAMTTAQSQYVSNIDPDSLFLHVLDSFLAMTYSETGFLLAFSDDQAEHLQLLAFNHKAWEFDTVNQYESELAQELQRLYQQQDPLVAVLINQQMTVIRDESMALPWLRSFMALPLISSGQLVGMIGLGNSPYPYGESLRLDLNPLLTSTAHIVQAWRNQLRQSEAEQQLRHWHQDLRQLVNSASAPIWGLDLAGYLNEWNPTAVELTGVSREDALAGMSFFQLVSSGDHLELEALLAQFPQGKAIRGVQLSFRHVQNTHAESRLLCSFTPRRNAQGELIAYWGIAQDISPLIDYRRRLEADVKSKTSQIEMSLHEQRQLTAQYQTLDYQAEALRTLESRFVMMASHQFREPLAAIRMAAGNLCDKGEFLNEEQKRRKLERIRDRANQISETLHDLLRLESYEKGHLQFHPENCHVRELCEQIVEGVLALTQHTHQIKLPAVDPSLQVCIDANLVRLILSNLLQNAIKFSPESREIWLRIVSQEESLCFEVEDRGMGITPEEHMHVFEKFYRSERAWEAKISGSGVGLSLVLQAVNLHQGKIEVQPLAQGCCMRVLLPLRVSA